MEDKLLLRLFFQLFCCFFSCASLLAQESLSDRPKQQLHLIEASGGAQSHLQLTLYWPGSRAQNLQLRLRFHPKSDKQSSFVILERGDWLNYYGSSEDHHVYRLELKAFPSLPYGGEGELEIEIFARGFLLAPLTTQFWATGDRDLTLVTPGSLRISLILEK